MTVAMLVLAGCGEKGGSSGGADAGDASTPANAAEAYRQVYAALGEPLLTSVAKQENSDAAVAQHAKQIERLVEATRSAQCDFGVD